MEAASEFSHSSLGLLLTCKVCQKVTEFYFCGFASVLARAIRKKLVIQAHSNPN